MFRLNMSVHSQQLRQWACEGAGVKKTFNDQKASDQRELRLQECYAKTKPIGLMGFFKEYLKSDQHIEADKNALTQCIKKVDDLYQNEVAINAFEYDAMLSKCNNP